MLEGEIGTLASGVVAQTDPAADTETKVDSIKLGYDITIKELNWVFANVVDAKAMSGFIELKMSDGATPYRFPIGFGAGGAATTSARKKGSLDVNIPVVANTTIDLYVTMCEATVGMWIGIKYVRGLEQSGITYGDCNTAEDAAVAADTLVDFSTIIIPPKKGGTIKKILVALANVVDAKASSGYVQLDFNTSKGRQRYPFGGGAGGATNSTGKMNAEEIEVDIPVDANEIITPKVYVAENAVDAHVGIIWVV